MSGDGDDASLSKRDASAYLANTWEAMKAEEMSTREEELENKIITIRGKTIHWTECSYSETVPPNGYSLWISMHGGGGCPAADNEEQYENQISLYNPSEGIWIIPRSPTDDWNQWHQEHIDLMFNRIIENYIMVKEINPNRVYILGYSAGGDGVYQLAPRMADRFAAASMMAGHPNDASPLALRNLPFAIFVGENDTSYDRSDLARQWGKKLDALEKSDPGGYRHHVQICPDMGHWMCGQDSAALSWMAQWSRQPWPKKVVWVQDDVIHDHFYWLSVPDASKAKKGQTVTAEVKGQTITITASEAIQELSLRLSDALIDLDQPITVNVDGCGEVFQGLVARSEQAIEDSLRRRADPASAASALLELTWYDA